MELVEIRALERLVPQSRAPEDVRIDAEIHAHGEEEPGNGRAARAGRAGHDDRAVTPVATAAIG